MNTLRKANIGYLLISLALVFAIIQPRPEARAIVSPIIFLTGSWLLSGLLFKESLTR